jgi:hypothetical protein
MIRVCQERNVLFALSVAILLGTNVIADPKPLTQPAPTGILIHLSAWKPSPFPEVALATPELAACFLLSPRWWSTAHAPAALPDQATLSRALGVQLQGVMEPTALPPLAVVVATAEQTSLAAVAHGDTALILQPAAETPAAVEIARTLAPVLVVAYTRPALPDPRCGEPLLMIGQAIADAGSLTLASLPPQLRPVRDWLQPKDALFALGSMVNEALDPVTHWQNRRARLRRMGQVGGPSPPLAAAAALVVEAFGDPPRARQRPLDLLLAWQKGSGKGFPPMPRMLRKALEKPLEAGMPKKKETAERDEVAHGVLARRLAAGPVPLAEVPTIVPLHLRLLAAAQLRAHGGAGLCEWLAPSPLPGLRTGCGSGPEARGIVFSRPAAGDFQVVWQAATGDQALLLTWPRWVLFPHIIPSTGELWFIDSQGVWHLPLDAHTAPQLAAGGSFRHLAAAPDGGAVVAARWPSGQVVVMQPDGTRELGVDGRGGLAFLDSDVLLASDGNTLSLASLEGQVRPDVLALPCCHSLAAARGTITAGVSAPCEPGLLRVGLTERTATPLLKLTDGPLGIVALPSQGYDFGGPEGLWSWSGQGAPQRISAGLTPGPG